MAFVIFGSWQVSSWRIRASPIEEGMTVESYARLIGTLQFSTILRGRREEKLTKEGLCCQAHISQERDGQPLANPDFSRFPTLAPRERQI